MAHRWAISTAALSGLLVLASGVLLARDFGPDALRRQAVQPPGPILSYDFARADGTVQGECRAFWIDFPPTTSASLRALFSSGRLTLVDRWVNWTTVSFGSAQNRFLISRDEHRQILSLEDDSLTLLWGDGGRVVPRPDGASRGIFSPLQAEFNAQTLTSERFEFLFSPPAAAREEWDLQDWSNATVWGRLHRFEGSAVQITGDVTLFVQEATVRQEAREFHVPTDQGLAVDSRPGPLSVRSQHYRYGILDLAGARIEIDPGRARFACARLDASIDGTLELIDGRTPTTAGEPPETPLPPRVLEGRFELHEELADFGLRPNKADGHGRELVSLTSTRKPLVPMAQEVGPDEALVRPAAGVEVARLDPWPLYLSTLAAGIVWVVWKIAAPLFARIRDDELLDSPVRRAIVTTVRSRPGIRLQELAAAVGLHYQTLRHHVRVLHRARLIRRWKSNAAWHVTVPGSDLSALRRKIRIASDPSLATMLRLLRPGQGVLAGDLLAGLQAEARLSPSGARKVIRRGVQLELVRRIRRGPDLFFEIACAESPTVVPGAVSLGAV